MSGSEAPGGAGVDREQLQLVLKEARDLAKALEGTATSRLRIEMGTLCIEIERGGGAVVTQLAPMAAPAPAAGAGGESAAAPATPGTLPVVAPLVGVFYRSSSPGAKPLVEVGDTVERGQPVGIIEAMKVMNEVTSDYRGTVVEILVENGEAVQYEQVLMRIDPGA